MQRPSSCCAAQVQEDRVPFVGMITEKWAKNDGCIYKSSPMVCRDNCAHRVARRDRPKAITPPS